ncbi:Clp protease N-terminal domain-containing protein [Aeoliella mucimassa]|uniref:ATP-dependent Clp protease ATP-binding subunit ClpC1 n=1 Tax=Aeoliella mucimassa TaxID=2527972 RepID=A0A518AS37_9BACT|nr:Clp protease N-terminal domain-containing protein [Aeoliella mucimassa]QDU57518.1 ATP-dependent Clp protease ATP-binding subunit ClpC1 [Aeoliella mucimassa]
MAFDKFTERARRIVDFAREEATQLGCDYVDSAHLLLGMLREGSGVAGCVLKHEDVDANKVREACEQHREGTDISLEEFESRCLAQVDWLGHNYAGTEHCILAICSLPDCLATQVLAKLGVTPEELCREVFCLLGHEEQFELWLDGQQRSPRDMKGEENVSMADYDSEITFPCFAGCSGYREESEVYLTEFSKEVAGKLCMPLFATRHLVEEYHQNDYVQHDSREELTIHAFEAGDELADYFLFRWVHGAGDILHYVLFDGSLNDIVVPRLVSRLIYHYDSDSLIKYLRHSPFYDGVPDAVEGEVYRRFPTERLPFDIGPFVLLPGGNIRLPEGRFIESDGSGQLCLLDDDRAIVNLILAGSEMTFWGGKMQFARGQWPTQVVFSSKDTGNWEYSFDPEKGWEERRLAGEASVNANADAPAGFMRCQVCGLWNAVDALECKVCKADLTVPHCSRCGAELEEEADGCKACEGD